MKVAHVTSQLCRNSAGLGAAVAALSSANQKLQNEVRVFGLSSSDWQRGDSTTWTGAPAIAFQPERWSGPLGYTTKMLAALIDFEPDIVHLHGLWTYPSIAVYRWHRKTGRHFVVSAHGMLMPQSLSYKPARKALARVMFQDRVLHAAKVLHATSTDEASAYGELGFTGQIEQIPLGVDAITPPHVLRDEAHRRVLFLGRLHHQKGLDWLIEAWKSLENEFPNWSLSIVGPVDGEFKDDLRILHRDADKARVWFHSPMYGDEKFRFIAESDLLVMPSRSENFGLAAAEALMMQIPVIATKGAPWSGLVSEGAGWWVDPNAGAIEQALRNAMSLPTQELARMGRNGSRWIEREFSWSVIGEKWQSVYEAFGRAAP